MKKAIDCVDNASIDGGFRVQPGKKRRFHRLMSDIVGDETNYDAHDHKITKQTMIQEMHKMLINVAEEIHDDPELDAKSVFDEKKREYCRNTIGSKKIEYEIAFPLNILNIEKILRSVATPETSIEWIERDKWKENYENPARENDKNHFERFLDRESPNSLEPNRYGNERFTFWKADYEARDGDYAMFAVQNITRFFISKLNYALYEGRGKMQPAGNDRPLYARWSPLQEPFFYLIFDDTGEYVNYWPMDFEYRRRAEIAAREDMDERIERFQKLPNLPTVNPELSALDEKIMNALLSFQDGITVESTQQSFFSFWRGIENLAQVERQQSHDSVTDRVLPLFNVQTTDEHVGSEEEEALNSLTDKRSNLVHEGPNSRITETHQLVAKRLLDNLFEFYFEYYDRNYDSDDFRMFLKYMADSQEENERSLEILEDVLNFRE